MTWPRDVAGMERHIKELDKQLADALQDRTLLKAENDDWRRRFPRATTTSRGVVLEDEAEVVCMLRGLLFYAAYRKALGKPTSRVDGIVNAVAYHLPAERAAELRAEVELKAVALVSVAPLLK